MKVAFHAYSNARIMRLCLYEHSYTHLCVAGKGGVIREHFHGHCSQKMRGIIPVLLGRVRTTRSSTHSHPFQVPLPASQTISHKSSFIRRACNLWNVLPSSCFPESYNFLSFKSKIFKLDFSSAMKLRSSPLKG